MNRAHVLLAAALLATLTTPTAQAVAPAPNGLERPEGYRDWRLIGVSQRTENGSLRAILGNDVAIRAAREGRINPWPDGAILAKIVWKQKPHPKFATAMVPDALVHTEFMVKDSARYAATGGWGFGRWLGLEQRPYGNDAGFVQECVGCHAPVKDNDWVFTAPVQLP
jgi:hypothetical protein